MLYNIKAVYLHCVFHGIRFKVNEDWVSVIDTLLFFMTKRQPLTCGVAVFFVPFCLVSDAGRYAEGGGDGRQDRDGDIQDFSIFIKSWAGRFLYFVIQSKAKDLICTK